MGRTLTRMYVRDVRMHVTPSRTHRIHRIYLNTYVYVYVRTYVRTYVCTYTYVRNDTRYALLAMLYIHMLNTVIFSTLRLGVQ